MMLLYSLQISTRSSKNVKYVFCDRLRAHLNKCTIFVNQESRDGRVQIFSFQLFIIHERPILFVFFNHSEEIDLVRYKNYRKFSIDVFLFSH